MTNLIEDYLRQVEASLRAESPRRRQIVDELRSHLRDKVGDLQRERPDRPVEEVEREVLNGLGSARDLALAYEPEGVAVLKNKAGDTVVRVGSAVGRGARAVGRGTGRALRWLAIAVAFLLVLGTGVAIWAYYEFKPYITALAEESDPVYDHAETCSGTPCSGVIPGDTFFVGAHAAEVKLDLDIWPEWDGRDHRYVGGGSVTLRVLDPSGVARFNDTFHMTNATEVSKRTTWAAVAGNWTVEYELRDFVGALDLEMYAVAKPWRDEPSQ